MADNDYADGDFYRAQDAKAGGTNTVWSDAADFDMGNEYPTPEVDIVPSSSGVLSQAKLAS